MGMWDVEATDEFIAWYDGMGGAERARVDASIEKLEEGGPGLGRPWVETIGRSRHKHMKELRPRGGFLRVLFIFDPRRSAILLIGGDKQNRWEAWYDEMIPVANDLYDTYLAELRAEGLL